MSTETVTPVSGPADVRDVLVPAPRSADRPPTVGPDTAVAASCPRDTVPTEPVEARPRRLGAWVKVVAGAGLVVAVVVHLGTGAVLDGLRAVSPTSLLAALVLGLLTTVASAWRWCLVARGLGTEMSLPGAVADCYRAQFLNSVLPAGVLGDVHRAVDHGVRQGDVGRSVRAVVLERVAGQVVVVVAGVGVLLVFPGPVGALLDALVPTGSAALATAGAVVAGLAAVALWARRGRRAARVRRVVVRGLATAAAEVRTGLVNARTGPGVLALSLVAMVGHLGLLAVAARDAGTVATPAELAPLLVLVLLAMGLPVNVGGWGPREAVAAVAFGTAGVGATQGLTTAVAFGVLALVSCLPGLGVLLLRRTGQSVVPIVGLGRRGLPTGMAPARH